MLTPKDWIENPLSLLADVRTWFGDTFKDEASLQQALASPNSFFVPREAITQAEAGRVLHQGCYIKVSTEDWDVVLCQDVEEENALNTILSDK